MPPPAATAGPRPALVRVRPTGRAGGSIPPRDATKARKGRRSLTRTPKRTTAPRARVLAHHGPPPRTTAHHGPRGNGAPTTPPPAATAAGRLAHNPATAGHGPRRDTGRQRAAGDCAPTAAGAGAGHHQHHRPRRETRTRATAGPYWATSATTTGRAGHHASKATTSAPAATTTAGRVRAVRVWIVAGHGCGRAGKIATAAAGVIPRTAGDSYARTARTAGV